MATSIGLDGPLKVHRLCSLILESWPMMRLGVHLHNTNGMALVAAGGRGRGREGVRRLDLRHRRRDPHAARHPAVRQRRHGGPRAPLRRAGASRRTSTGPGGRAARSRAARAAAKEDARARARLGRLVRYAPSDRAANRPARRRTCSSADRSVHLSRRRRRDAHRTPEPGAVAVVGVSLAALAAGTFSIVGLGVLAPELKARSRPEHGRGRLPDLARLHRLDDHVAPGGRLTDAAGPARVLGFSLAAAAASLRLPRWRPRRRCSWPACC